ncbi:hypothetical protein BST81_01595 [Leptolyngbya sp. 'hensonii']|uniref:hypothetical protein n=1 Tax=Leptolyngbya sp. 'hensonii' TaxID=1922337 RepID=UPI00094FE13E|nr:hypothetical protein [Leptolyngbya sp. 'hensonii']OLP20218.1 hypothetical protein BST81_01595 [Leptolyngbya sp. 'hensonii']
MDVYINNKKIRIDPKRAIGKGGEADIFDLGKGQALKLFKQPGHPDYQGAPQEQQAAQARLAEHQHKLRQFPGQLPGRVIHPEALATDAQGQQVLGYAMRLVQGAEVLARYGDRSFRQAGIPQQTVVEIFQDLHATVSKLHFHQVVIGDFNDLNVLVQGQSAYLIDADSFQYGSFLCQVFTSRFVDPLRCDPQQNRLILHQPHNSDSDWYAFTVMLMQSLLFVDPYGGVYRPQNPAQRLPHDARPLQRITVFHPEVRYPKPALPYGILPDELLHHFHQVFEQDQRGEFPRSLLDRLRWTTCTTCGREHARSVCPDCAQAQPGAVKEVTVVRGTVVATRVFTTAGVILQAGIAGGTLRWLYHDRGHFYREEGTIVFSGDLDPRLRFRFQGAATLVGQQGQVLTLKQGQVSDRLAVDLWGQTAMFETNEVGRYWLHNGQLLRDGPLGPEYIGDVLAHQTCFWVGSHFGFGFYRAGNLSVAFVFDTQRRGLNDSLKLPPIPGQLLDARCVFSQQYCWFLTASQTQGRTLHRCTLIQSDGTVIAVAEAEKGDGSWLSSLKGHCAAGNFLLTATDEGIVRLQPEQGQIVKTREFPDTEPFVDTASQLFAGQQGLYVVRPQEIFLLKIH